MASSTVPQSGQQEPGAEVPLDLSGKRNRAVSEQVVKWFGVLRPADLDSF